jgi:p-cumate 2,3-dioxygenase alpha subunit
MSHRNGQPLIIDDMERGLFRVHRSTMTSPEIFEQERERIFDRCWLYLGHDSEIPEPGDFLRRTLNGRSIMFLRSDDGEVRAFHNTCPHRGAIVCRKEHGNQKVFQCFYHAWTFDSRGRLTGMPSKEGYDNTGFDRAERNLKHVAHLDEYRGFWFLSFAPEIVSLREYLAGAADVLDLIIDQSPSGRMRIAEGTHKYSSRANWKLLAENSVDGYHGVPTHQTYLDYVLKAGGTRAAEEDGKKLGTGRAYSLGNGHVVGEYWAPWGRPVARWVPQMGEDARPEIEATRRELEERHGPDRAERISEYNRNLLIFPNLVVNDIMAVTVRTFYPSAPDMMEVNAWALAPEEEEGDRLQTRLHNFLEFLGPGGFATPDDVEALESCQIGFAAGGEEWNDISRGIGREPLEQDELQMRAFWRQWLASIEGRTLTEWSDRPDVGVFPKEAVIAG